MKTYIAQRLGIAVLTLFGMSIVIFGLLRLAPGDIVDVLFSAAGYVNPAEKKAILQELGMDRPVWVQYLDWIGQILRGEKYRFIGSRVAAHLGAEVVRVGTALGHRVEPILGIAAARFAEASDPAAIETLGKEIAADAGSRSGGRPSMLQDVMKGRRTEIDHLNGFVSAQGRHVGVPTPFNDAVVEAFHAQPVGALAPAPRLLDPLVRLLG